MEAPLLLENYCAFHNKRYDGNKKVTRPPPVLTTLFGFFCFFAAGFSDFVGDGTVEGVIAGTGEKFV